jgi:HD superfamily phosphohydrolase
MLNNVLHNFIDWYVMVYKENDNKIYNRLLKMILYLIIGLKRLQKTYKKGNIVYVLQYYINVLQSIFDDKYDDKMLFRPFDEEEYDETKYSTIFDTNKLRNFWSSKDIISISNQLNKCFSFDDEKNECYPINENNSIIKGTLVGIDAIMENMDDKFKKIIYKSVKGS